MKNTIKFISLLLAVIMAAAAFVGCAGNKPATTTPAPVSDPTQAPSDTANPGTRTLGIRPANGSGAQPAGELDKAYIDASNAFAATLVNAMGENWTGVVSPVSFGMLLEMLANGASSDDSVAILKAMLIEMGMEASNENAARLIAALIDSASDSNTGKNGTPSKFNMNSAILVSEGDSFTKDFETAIADHFRASIGSIDFSDTDKALETINGWVSENTNGLIPKLFDQIPGDTAMALVNSLYFNAFWRTPFVTYKGDPDAKGAEVFMFNGINGEQPASMLVATSEYPCGEFDGDQVVLVPYADGAYYMAVILPADGKTASAAFADTVSRFSECMSAPAYIAMPAIELSTNFDAMPTLEKLGLGSIVKGDTQFPNIVEGGGIRLTQFVHAATLTVTESGTEASAASGATGSKSAPIAADPVYRIICNRPYAMAIVHAETGAVLFASTVNELPAAAADMR
ncbi:MAG: serpin family protein [Clostridia bacterium]|nr:serpin family protein [Clostridia bacterium]